VSYLERTLRSLSAQTLDRSRWELIVVDNASLNPVAGIADLSWHGHGRHLSEPEVGLALARRCGIRASSGGVLVFVDDDNVLSPDYLTEALRIERDWHFLGSWGSGCITPEFEVWPADHLRELVGFLGIRNVDRPIWSNAISCTDATPIGAGLCIRRQIGEAYVEYAKSTAIHISGRKGSSLGGHEDYEISYLACKEGLGMGLFPELKMVHLIGKERVSEARFLNLVEGVTASHLVLDYKWKGKVPRSPFSLHGVGSFVVNVLTRHGFDRRVFFAELRADMSARREIAGATKS
jgi:glycosyltransferase involved in cell wall biosynthesis